MDPEELWRQALLEEASKSKANNNGSHINGNGSHEDDDDGFDADLLSAAPCAFDAVPDDIYNTNTGATGSLGNNISISSSSSSNSNAMGSYQSGIFTASPVLGNTLYQDEADELDSLAEAPFTRQRPDNSNHHNEEEVDERPKGVCAFPPADRPSFMLRGDRGVVRWVTASGLEEKKNTGKNDHHNSSNTNAVSREEAAIRAVGVSFSNAFTDSDDNDDDNENNNGSGGGGGGRKASIDRRHGTGGGLLGADNSIHDLLRKVHADRAKAAQRAAQEEGEESRRQQQQQQQLLMSGDGDGGVSPSDKESRPLHHTSSTNGSTTANSSSNRSATNTATSKNSGELWVSRYAPKGFREVLSDETINLQLLRWLKEWDPFVFGRRRDDTANGSSARAGNNSTNKTATPPPAPSGTIAITPAAAAAVGRGEGGPHPPEERMAILAGPPGVGKTTLVHVLARHCGYEVIEINASVERTYSRLEAVIRTAVSGAGAAAAGGSHRPAPRNKSNASPSASAAVAPRSLVDHLLAPKCLVIDEMDGIQSNVAHLLLSLDIRRPVFCMCNDWYVPALRPLRSKVHHIYHLPPIRPQRLLSRLEEIAAREALPVERTALAELVRMNNGDVRSCLNTMQFLQRGLSVAGNITNNSGNDGDDSHVSDAVGSVPSAARAMELFRRMQGKDTSRDIWDSWSAVFTRADRAKSVQLLKKGGGGGGGCGFDYDAIVDAASVSAQRYQAALAMRRRREREGVVLNRTAAAAAPPPPPPPPLVVPTLSGSGVAAAAASGGVGITPVLGFRVDPAFIYASHQLGCGGGDGIASGGGASSSSPSSDGGGGRTFLSGLQENYLRRPYTDYSLAQTARAADGFSFHNLISSQAFSSSTHGAGALIGLANRYEAVTALRVFASCSSSAKGERLRYPREEQTARQRESEAAHVIEEFRESCSGGGGGGDGGYTHKTNYNSSDKSGKGGSGVITATNAANFAFLWCDETVSGDVCPLLMRCLFDSSVRLPPRAVADLGALPAADQRMMRAAVARHAAYGLTYRKVCLSSLPRFQSSSSGYCDNSGCGYDRYGERIETWVLSPSIDELGGLAGAAISGDRSLSVSGGSGGGGGSGLAGMGSTLAAPRPDGGYQGKSTTAAASASSLSVADQRQPVFRPKDDMKELLVGEINRFEILARAAAIKERRNAASISHSNSNATAPKRGSTDVDAVAGPGQQLLQLQTLKRQRVEAEEEDTATAKRRKEADEKKAEEEEAPPPAVVPTGPVRRDFFGRIITANPPKKVATTRAAAAATTAAAAGASGASEASGPTTSKSVSPAGTTAVVASAAGRQRQQERLNPPVKYIYQDGSTNAVKMPAAFDDF